MPGTLPSLPLCLPLLVRLLVRRAKVLVRVDLERAVSAQPGVAGAPAAEFPVALERGHLAARAPAPVREAAAADDRSSAAGQLEVGALHGRPSASRAARA